MSPSPSQIPFKRGRWLTGCLAELRRDPLLFLRSLSSEYGDVAGFHVGRRTIYQFAHPQAVREILVSKHEHFRKTGLILQARPILGNGLLTSEGDTHTRQRRMIQPAFSQERIRQYSQTVVEHTSRLGESWRDGQSLDLYDCMLDTTLKIIVRAMFDVDVDAEASSLEHSINVAIEYFNKLLSPSRGILSKLPLPENNRCRAAKRNLDDFVARLIASRRNSGVEGRRDVLSQLIRVRDEEGDGRGMDDRQIRDEIITLLTAGHETIANAMTWTWYLLSRHPEIEEQFHREVDEVVGEGPARMEDLPRLKFTRNVFAESMRLYPPLWALSRMCVEACEINGTPVPAGTIVGVSQYVTQRDERFFPNPDAFDPARWETASPDRPKFAYFPFGCGPRTCIGESLAWMEGPLMLADIARNWRIEVPRNHLAVPHPLITLRPRGGLPAVVRNRRRAAGTRSAVRELALPTA